MTPDSLIADPEYQSALRWLYGLSPNVRTASQIVADHPRKLARMRALLDRLGRPDSAFVSVLIAGTKGKGSIAACTESILRAAGYRTGLITSPHLVTWCERTRIGAREIEPAVAARLMPVVREAVERLAEDVPALGQVTTFEAGVALALVAFQEAGVELAVVEAGVGGAHDATNVLDPLAVALGPISYDHLGTLGSTLTAITTEKTGIFRRGRLAVVSPQPAEALAVIERVAGEQDARLERLGREWTWSPDDDQPCRGAFTVAGPRGTFWRLTIPLVGGHQRENAAVAVALATGVISERDSRMPSGSAESAVREGLATVRWPGRFQIVRERPWLVVDGAHNGDSARRLAESVEDCFPAPTSRRHLVFGTSVGKDVPRMLDALLPLVSTVTLTRSHHERSVRLDDLSRALGSRGIEASVVPEVRDAVERVVDQAEPDDLVLVTGSLFVVGEVLEANRAVTEATP